MFRQLLFWAGNQCNYQHFDPSLLPKKLTDFYRDEAKKKWPTQKKMSFSIPPILNIFFQKLQVLVLGQVKLIEAKGINLCTWSSDGLSNPNSGLSYLVANVHPYDLISCLKQLAMCARVIEQVYLTYSAA